MEQLKLPEIKDNLPAGRFLSMDDYLKFVVFNLRHTVRHKLSKKTRNARIVNEPFSLR